MSWETKPSISEISMVAFCILICTIAVVMVYRVNTYKPPEPVKTCIEYESVTICAHNHQEYKVYE